MALPEEPYTRVERYLARLAGQNVDIPEYPITRIECYLDYLCGNGGGVPASNAGGHNAVFRGKDLGTSFTTAQAEAIASGTFDDLYVGDYWTDNGRVYRIAGFECFPIMASSDSRAHYIVVLPDSPLYNAAMNPSATVEGGYLGSAMKTTGLDSALDTFKGFFGESHLKPRSDFLTNAVSGGSPSGGEWTETYIDLMTEAQIFGVGIGNSASSASNMGISYNKFPLFVHMPKFVLNQAKAWYWLRDIASATTFAGVSTAGGLITFAATSSRGVRPFVCVA